MITVLVRLYGTLPRRFEGYDPQKGLTVALWPGADTSDLLRHLGLVDETVAAVIDGMIVWHNRPLADGALVRLFQPAQGG